MHRSSTCAERENVPVREDAEAPSRVEGHAALDAVAGPKPWAPAPGFDWGDKGFLAAEVAGGLACATAYEPRAGRGASSSESVAASDAGTGSGSQRASISLRCQTFRTCFWSSCMML